MADLGHPSVSTTLQNNQYSSQLLHKKSEDLS